MTPEQAIIAMFFYKKPPNDAEITGVSVMDLYNDLVKAYKAGQQSNRESLPVDVREVEFNNLFKLLCQKLNEDKDSKYSLYYVWQSNIAMAFLDEAERFCKANKQKSLSKGAFAEVGNNAAINFLESLLRTESLPIQQPEEGWIKELVYHIAGTIKDELRDNGNIIHKYDAERRIKEIGLDYLQSIQTVKK